MLEAYEGEILATNKDIEYDYLEIKYKKTARTGKKPYIQVPVDEESDEEMDKDLYKQLLRENLSPESTSESEISNNSDEQNYFSLARESNSGEDSRMIKRTQSIEALNKISREYVKMISEKNKGEMKCMIVNYIKREEVKERVGIMKYNEFRDLRVREKKIVLTEIYHIKKLYEIQVDRKDKCISVEIKPNCYVGEIRVYSNAREIFSVESDDKRFRYEIFAKSSKIAVLCKNNIQRFEL
ncbi:hypothetical protein ENBRE01_1527 [Enteropsectra breve]|nr:hypothetical protein ENBRE01_1527 [Enteropsectra breve]